MRFGAPYFLPWLVLVVVLAWLLWLYRRWQSQTLQAWASPRFRTLWKVRPSRWYILWSDGVLCLGVALLLFALARPQWGWTQGQIKQRGMELVVILDVSPSMYLTDVRPTRWHRAVFALHAFAEQFSGVRIALVAFDGEAGLQSPFTDDIAALRELAWYSRPGLFPAQGRGLAAALALARQQLQSRKRMHDAGAVVVLTDGQANHTETTIQEAQQLKQSKISFYVVGVGGLKPPSRSRGKPPSPRGAQPPWLRRSTRSLPSWRPLNTAPLRQVAKAGDGSYWSLTTMGRGLLQVRQALYKMQRTERARRQRKKPRERYPVILGLAALCFALHRILQA